MASDQQIKLGVIGTGLALRHLFLSPLLRCKKLIKISALCNRTPEKAEAFADENELSCNIYEDHHKMLSLEDLDAVLVLVTIEDLATITQDALRAGKHVLQTKPIATDVASAKLSIDLAQEKDKVFMVAENFRYLPQFGQVYEIIKSGIIGEPKLYRLNDIHYTYSDNKWATEWRQRPQFRGGYLLDGGPHIVAGMRNMIQSDVKLIHGLTTKLGVDFEHQEPDTLFLHLVFQNGVYGQMALGNCGIDRDARKPKVYGTKGTLVLSPKEGKIEIFPVNRDEIFEPIPTERTEDVFYDICKDFYRAVTLGDPPLGTAVEALKDLMIIDAGLRSAASGQVITL